MRIYGQEFGFNKPDMCRLLELVKKKWDIETRSKEFVAIFTAFCGCIFSLAVYFANQVGELGSSPWFEANSQALFIAGFFCSMLIGYTIAAFGILGFFFEGCVAFFAEIAPPKLSHQAVIRISPRADPEFRSVVLPGTFRPPISS